MQHVPTSGGGITSLCKEKWKQKSETMSDANEIGREIACKKKETKDGNNARQEPFFAALRARLLISCCWKLFFHLSLAESSSI